MERRIKMKELEIQIANELISFYNQFIIEGLTEGIKNKAGVIESKYLNTSTLVSEILTDAIVKLTYFYVPIKPGPISKEEAKRIVKELKSKFTSSNEMSNTNKKCTKEQY